MRRRDNRAAVAETRELQRLCLDLKEWREHHRPPTAIPANLWDRAVDLAGRLGVGPTARALHLDHGALKRRVANGARLVRATPAPTEFIELLAPVSAGIPECALEVESPRGGRMRVVMKNVTPQGLGCILRDFVG